MLSGISGAIQAFVCLTIVASSAGAAIQEPLNENLIPSSTAAHPHGEIEYTFDTTLNKGTARYRTSLASGNFLKRLLISPDVHTLVATYEFAGRKDRLPPSTIQLTLISDEYRVASQEGPRPTHVTPVLVVYLDNSESHFPLGVAQSTEVWSNAPQPRRTLIQIDRIPQINVNVGATEVHVHRSGTASLRACEFLTLANARELRGTVAGLDFHFSEEVLAGMRKFVAEMRLPATMC